MDRLLDDLKPELVVENIVGCVEREQIATESSEHRFLIFEVSGPPAYSNIVYHGDHAATSSEIARRALDRVPGRGCSQTPPIDYGVVFDTRTQGFVAFLYRDGTLSHRIYPRDPSPRS